MNKQKNSILINDTADVGIGTLIIFIAMVLVAAVAAAVLIQTSGILQQKAQQTGKEAATEVTSNLNIVSVIGNIGTQSGTEKIDNLTIAVQLSAGGQNIDFQSVVMKYIDNQTSNTMNYTTANLSAPLNTTSFNYSEERSTGTPNTVLQVGELSILTIQPSNPLGLREKGLIEIVPETGTMIMKEVIAPSTWGTKNYIQLFP
ncbi:MAG: flagellin [Candidatus Methanoperedenaceae archaeon]|nr:MAG: flagellin [Candidatus Methanoperedenaceae archaeon]